MFFGLFFEYFFNEQRFYNTFKMSPSPFGRPFGYGNSGRAACYKNGDSLQRNTFGTASTFAAFLVCRSKRFSFSLFCLLSPKSTLHMQCGNDISIFDNCVRFDATKGATFIELGKVMFFGEKCNLKTSYYKLLSWPKMLRLHYHCWNISSVPFL